MLCGSSLRAGIIVLYRSYHYSGPTIILARKPSDESARGWRNPKISGNNGMAGVGNFAASRTANAAAEPRFTVFCGWAIAAGKE